MNELHFPILSLITFLPLFGAMLLLTIRTSADNANAARNAKNAYNVTLFISGVTLALSCFMYSMFDAASASFQFNEKYTWISSPEITFELGVDGLSVFFVLLTAFLVPAALLISRTAVKQRLKEYCLAFLVLETMIIGSFLTPDLLFFYIFFEGALIPMFLIIGIWGGARRIYASFKFFLFTLTGSILMLIGLVYIFTQTGSTDIEAAAAHAFTETEQIMLFLAFFASFAVKVPMWPFHTWLPDAHVEAPTAGSVILAGVLLKMGGYGFLRFSVPLFPLGTQFFAPYLSALAVIAVIYASLTALAQSDIKKTVAYSSVAHMGFVILGIFSLSIEGISGAVFQMISHGIISAALFMSVGVLYERFHTREIAMYGGLADTMPRFAVLLMIFVLGSIGLPGTSGFVGEFLTLTGTYLTRPVYALFGVTGVVLGAVYMLSMYKRLMFGSASRAELSKAPDVNSRELAILSIAAFLILALGIVSYKITDVVKPISEATVSGYYKSVQSGMTTNIIESEKGGNVK